MINQTIMSAIDDALQHLLEEAGLRRPDGWSVVVEHPANAAHGDYSTNAAMQLARTLRKAPLAIAADLAAGLRLHPAMAALFAKIDVAPPGFINLYVDWAKWSGHAAESLPAAGKGAGDSIGKVLIEHTSINPNKSAHIGHLRNSCIGDTLARMLRRSGRKVEVHNYIDDLGNQLADTVVGIKHMQAGKPHLRFGDFCWDIYARINKAYNADPALQEERSAVLHELEQGNTNTAWMGLLVAERIVREHLEELERFRIGYDVLVWESSIVRAGFWAKAFELLRQTTAFRQETEGKLAGCWVLKQTGEEEQKQGDEEHHVEKVLVRSNGILTYTAKDIAYHLWKFGVLGQDFRYRKFADGLWSTTESGSVNKRIGRADTVINVIDHRQEYPQTMVKEALVALGFKEQAERLRHVGYGVVSLSPATAAGLGVDTSDGKPAYAMSGRQGVGIKVADFLERMEAIIDAKRSRKAGISSKAIAAASARYYLLRFHLQTEVVFDLEQATEVSGNTGVYLMYAHARASSILEKAAYAAAPADPAWFRSLAQEERELLRQLAYWPETFAAAVKELAPHQVCSYAYELANLFNHFYASCPIMKAEGAARALRLWLTARFQTVLHDALDVLGLPAPKKM